MTLRFRQFLPATISRAVAAMTKIRKLTSMIAAASQPISAENVTPMRPTSQTANSTSNGMPWIGNRPVQFGMAVSRNPVTTAGR